MWRSSSSVANSSLFWKLPPETLLYFIVITFDINVSMLITNCYQPGRYQFLVTNIITDQLETENRVTDSHDHYRFLTRLFNTYQYRVNTTIPHGNIVVFQFAPKKCSLINLKNNFFNIKTIPFCAFYKSIFFLINVALDLLTNLPHICHKYEAPPLPPSTRTS